MTLVISMGEAGEGALEDFRELLGPTSVEEAKESAPERCVMGHSHTRPPPLGNEVYVCIWLEPDIFLCVCAVCVQSTALALGRMLFMAVTAVRALQGTECIR